MINFSNITELSVKIFLLSLLSVGSYYILTLSKPTTLSNPALAGFLGFFFIIILSLSVLHILFSNKNCPDIAANEPLYTEFSLIEPDGYETEDHF